MTDDAPPSQTETPGPVSVHDFACEQDGCGWLPKASSDPSGWNRSLQNHRRLKHQLPTAGPRRRADQPAIKIDLRQTAKAGKDDPALAAVARRAEGAAKFAAVVVLLAGQDADAADIERGSERFGAAVRDLAEHEKWLRDWLGKEAGDAGRAMAWLQFGAAAMAIAMPILLRHEVIAGGLAQVAANMFSMVEAMPMPAAAGDEPGPEQTGAPSEPVADAA